jgi:hypothetical protein
MGAKSSRAHDPWRDLGGSIPCDPTISTTNHFLKADTQAAAGYSRRNPFRRGVRIIHGSQKLMEKPGSSDLCPAVLANALTSATPNHAGLYAVIAPNFLRV